MRKITTAASLFFLLASPVFATSIDISNARHILTLHNDDGTIKTYPVALGRMGAAISGQFTVGEKQVNPAWTPTPNMIKKEHMSSRTVPPGPNNPLGPRILHLYQNNHFTYYGIHGTNAERVSFYKDSETGQVRGRSVSHGCFRMRRRDILELYDLVPIGTTVSVK